MSNIEDRIVSRISTAVAAASVLLGACSARTEVLPSPVYYLTGSGADAQVWRLENDGVLSAQLTDIAAGVRDFSVSQADGSLAYISDDQLFLADSRGQNQVLVANGRQTEQGSGEPMAYGLIESPVFSPDGKTLAYAFEGLHLYDIETGEDEHILTNQGNLLSEPYIFAKENYSPGPWSPDGEMLLIIMSYFEGSTLAVMEPDKAEPFRRLWSENPVCCTYHWASDSGSVFVANPSFGVHWPGLWRYDAETGEKTELVTTSPDSPRFVGWPVQLPSGDLLYFYGDHFSPVKGIPQVLVRSGPDGQDQTQVRPDEFLISDALWAEDGSLVLISQFSEPGTMQLILARPDGSPLQVLFEGDSIRHLAWGP